jgi:hypothetical protein
VSTHDLPLPRDAWRHSLRASQERRIAAFQRRRRRLRGRTGAAMACLSLTVLVSGALAAPAGPLRTGTTGAPVAALQRALSIPADGIYGPQTRAAVKRFQRRSGLAVDGIAGTATLSALGVPAATAAQLGKPRAATPPADTDTGMLARIAVCESGGDPSAVSPDGTYRGKYQFSRATWRAMGGIGDPAAAPEPEQDDRAAMLLQRQGLSAWPVCSRQ